jgi:hypothetical protein
LLLFKSQWLFEVQLALIEVGAAKEVRSPNKGARLSDASAFGRSLHVAAPRLIIPWPICLNIYHDLRQVTEKAMKYRKYRTN